MGSPWTPINSTMTLAIPVTKAERAARAEAKPEKKVGEPRAVQVSLTTESPHFQRKTDRPTQR